MTAEQPIAPGMIVRHLGSPDWVGEIVRWVPFLYGGGSWLVRYPNGSYLAGSASLEIVS